MHYNGEHIAIGFAGQVLILVSVISLIAALVCYIFSCQEKLLNFRSWRFYGRHWFRLHFFSVLAAMGVLWYLLINHYVEYKYVWEHTSSGLSLGYLISSLWAGKEGSILLWFFFQGLIGVIVMQRSGDFERPVMVVFSVSQLFLNAALLGVHIGDIQIGNHPFVLLRNAPENILNPFFANADYLSIIKPGAGLNPLLQNFWMKAHPPVLFLGFASMLVPFSYAFAALWKDRYTGWLRPVIPWMSFGILAMGAGTLMGGAWAYEDLTFGGFWSWDPVENSSLVIWLACVISLHLVMISIVNKQTLFPAFILTFLSYVMVLYSTFLTRSGVLGSTSAHTFGKTGMIWHLAIYIIIFFSGSLILLLLKAKKLPRKKNEKFLSREFWMFIGCIVLILSAFQIIFSTSAPLINKILGKSISNLADVTEYYNSWQLPFATVTLFVVAFTQFLTYGKNFSQVFIRKFLPSLIISFILSVLLYLFSGIKDIMIILLALSSIFVIFSSFDVMLRHYRYSKNFPSLLGHLGLGTFIFGIVLAFAQSSIISKNSSPVYFRKSFNSDENILLKKDSLTKAEGYYLCYSKKEKEGDENFYEISFYNDFSGPELFAVRPSVISGSAGKVYRPDTRHLLLRDIFTYVLYAENGGTKDDPEYSKIKESTVKRGDTVKDERMNVIIDSIASNAKAEGRENCTAFMKISTDGKNYKNTEASFKTMKGNVLYYDAVTENKDCKLRIDSVTSCGDEVVLGLYTRKNDIVIVKSVIFPYIKILWIGGILMLTGFFLSVIKRRKYRLPSENYKE